MILYFSSALYFLIISFSCVSHSLVAKKQDCTFYKNLEQHCLSSVAWEDEDWPNEPFYDYLMRCMRYQRNPQEAKKRRAAFKILDTCKQQDKSKPSHVLDDPRTWEDLCIFYTPNKKAKSLISIIDRTRTELGKTMLSSMLVQPITDSTVLRKRQQLLKELINNPDLLAQLDKVLQTFAQNENFLMSFWGQDPLRQAVKRNYYNIPYFTTINNALNSSPTALNSKVYLDHSKRVTFFLCTIFAAAALPLYGILRFANVTVPKETKDAAALLRASGGTAIGVLATLTKFGLKDLYHNKHFQGSIATISGWACGLSAKDEYEWTRDNFILLKCLQEKLIAVARSIASLKSIDSLISCNEAVLEGLSMERAFSDFLYRAPYYNENLKNLDELLDTTTFKKKPNALSHAGRIMTAYNLMHDQKDEWIRVLAAVGELDAYVSMAKLYKEHVTTTHPYCFAEFVSHDKPLLELQNFWNPFISADKVVPSSIQLGAAAQRPNMVVTGPNAGGKSTILRAAAINLIMAQSFGIAPASAMTLTPFYSISTYLNIADDITTGTSLFKAEVMRAQSIIHRISTLEPQQFSFIIVDEMFSGTAPKEGQAAAYSIAKNLGHYANNICVIATHYNLLTKLEQDTSVYTNYKVTVDIQPDGSIHYPFTLTPGISNQNVALAMLKAEGFASSILDEAQAIINT